MIRTLESNFILGTFLGLKAYLKCLGNYGSRKNFEVVHDCWCIFFETVLLCQCGNPY